MEQVVQPAPHPASSFGKVLASLTSKLHDDKWDDSALADDVAILTYEQALRKTRSARGSDGAASLSLSSVPPANAVSPPRLSRARPKRSEEPQRGASVTIRMTAEEHARLKERAASAELSVSAYLRSCIFEAESLRTQVREALAQMQPAEHRPAARSRYAGLFPLWFRRRRADA